MGSFSYTCTVSGLAIEAGTPVRFCILMENTCHTPGRPTCYPGDLWRLRSLPFRARYDECGSVDRIEQPMLANMLFDSFKLDAIERGPGDNTYHDVAVRKGMSQKEWFDAISEGRVICRPSWSETPSDPKPPLPKDKNAPAQLHKWKYPPGYPTRRRVEKLLKGLPDKYVVDRFRRGFIRVRSDVFGDCTAQLQRAVEAIQPKFAAMITVGTGPYADYGEVLVAPKPGAEGHVFSSMRIKKADRLTKPIQVCQAMIREDVWQLLLKIGTVEVWDGKKLKYEGLEYTKANVRKLWQDERKKVAQIRKAQERALTEEDRAEWIRMDLRRITDFDDSSFVGRFIRSSDSISLGYGLRTAWRKAVEDLSDADAEEFLDTLAETCLVSSALHDLRFQWHPGTSCGPQFGDWEAHAKYLRGLTDIIESQKVSEEDE